MLYLWIKALHVVAIISWMAGMLYLVRLYVNHAMETEGIVMERFQGMERRLLNAITTPAMVVSVLTGTIMLVMMPYLLTQPWMHVKLACAGGMLVMHALAMVWRKQLIETPHFKTHTFFRYMNEIPTLLMLVIVVMVIVRPFSR